MQAVEIMAHRPGAAQQVKAKNTTKLRFDTGKAT
jgi:hypothetical protein